MSRNLPILRSQATESFCGMCPDKGHCCKDFMYHRSFWIDEGIEAAQKQLSDSGMPFLVKSFGPAYKEEGGTREYASVRCDCPKLGEDGRCTIYETRPRICRIFAAGSDPLCIFSSMSVVEFKWNYPAIRAGKNDAKLP